MLAKNEPNQVPAQDTNAFNMPNLSSTNAPIVSGPDIYNELGLPKLPPMPELETDAKPAHNIDYTAPKSFIPDYKSLYNMPSDSSENTNPNTVPFKNDTFKNLNTNAFNPSIDDILNSNQPLVSDNFATLKPNEHVWEVEKSEPSQNAPQVYMPSMQQQPSHNDHYQNNASDSEEEPSERPMIAGNMGTHAIFTNPMINPNANQPRVVVHQNQPTPVVQNHQNMSGRDEDEDEPEPI